MANQPEGLLSFLRAHKRFEDVTPLTQNSLSHLESLMVPDVVNVFTTIKLAEESKQVTVEFPPELTAGWPYLELVQMCDLQFGHKYCRVDKVIEFRDWVLSKPYRFVYWVGDIIDAAHAFTPGATWDNLFEQRSQVYQISEVFAPMRHRILGSVGGNHERRGLPVFGDLGTLIAAMLQIPYSRGRQYVDIYYGEHKPFQTLLWHGHPRARTKGALAQIMDRFMRIGRAQLYLTGHNHQSLVVPNFREVPKSGKVVAEKYVGGQGTSFLEVMGTYAEWMGFEAYDLLMPVARLFENGKWEYVVA